MTVRQPDSVVPRPIPLVVQGRSASTREADPEQTPATDTAILAPRFTRSVAPLASHGP